MRVMGEGDADLPDKMGIPTRPARPTIPKRTLRSACAAVIALVLAASTASAHTPAPPFEIAWEVDLPTPVSAPVAIGMTAVVVGRDAVLGIDEMAGEIAWSIPRAGGSLLRPAVGYVDGAAIVVYVEDAEAASAASPSPDAATPAELVAIDLETRAERWRVSFEAGLPGGVLAWGANAYVVDGGGTLTAVSLDDGTTAWEEDAVGAGDAPPVGFEDAIYVAGAGASVGAVRISAFDAATGERRWAKSPESATSTTSALAVGAEVVAYAGNDRLLHVLERADGTERWTALLGNLPSPVTAPLVDADAVYVVDFAGTVGRFDLATGERAWSFPLNDLVVRASPFLAEDAIVVGTSGGDVVALDRASGRLIADLATGEGLIGGFAVPEHLLVVAKGGADPRLLGLDTDPTGELLDVPSPLEPDLLGLLGRFALAALVALAMLGVPPRLARLLRRSRRELAAPDADAGGGA